MSELKSAALSLLLEENAKLRELLVEAAHCIHEMEGNRGCPDLFAKHAMEFRGIVSGIIRDKAPWGEED